jgi:triosephosphate isomerase
MFRRVEIVVEEQVDPALPLRQNGDELLARPEPELPSVAKLLGDHESGVELVIARPLTALQEAKDSQKRWSLAAQNVASEFEGAYTGEVSARMLADAGCRYVIVAHSERRRLFGEAGPVLARKLARAREAGLTPIYCVGETREEREEGLTDAILAAQVETLAEDPAAAPLVVAYEPVWAIGAGRAATARDVGAARRQLAELLSGRREVRILYGGSVTSENASELLEACQMDGFLIGGASLKASTFARIAGSPDLCLDAAATDTYTLPPFQEARCKSPTSL